MEQRTFFIAQNVYHIEEGIDLISSMNDETYSLNGHKYFTSGIGRHFRHILDHYACFLTVGSGRVDYDARTRDQRIETDRRYAIDFAREIVEKLRNLDSIDINTSEPLAVSSNEGENPNKVSSWCSSSLTRELQYLVSHTIHHYALLAMIYRLLGFTPPEEFGVAPSTLQYEKSLENVG